MDYTPYGAEPEDREESARRVRLAVLSTLKSRGKESILTGYDPSVHLSSVSVRAGSTIQDTDDLVSAANQIVETIRSVAQRYQRFPAQPPIGTVLCFEYQFNLDGKPYQYVAFRAPNGAWYLTGMRNRAQTWDEVVTLIGNNPCQIVTEWTEVPTLPETDAGNTDPTVWAKNAWQLAHPEA